MASNIKDRASFPCYENDAKFYFQNDRMKLADGIENYCSHLSFMLTVESRFI